MMKPIKTSPQRLFILSSFFLWVVTACGTPAIVLHARAARDVEPVISNAATKIETAFGDEVKQITALPPENYEEVESRAFTAIKEWEQIAKQQNEVADLHEQYMLLLLETVDSEKRGVSSNVERAAFLLYSAYEQLRQDSEGLGLKLEEAPSTLKKLVQDEKGNANE